jgi:hypothetical protein
VTNASIILINDHTLLRNLLTASLEEDPALTVAGGFSNATEGINACLKLAPTLVIVRCMLPDGKGLDVVRALAPKLAGTRFLILSSLEKAHIVREAIDAGVHGFVMKRASYETLVEAIHAVIAGKSYYCPISSGLLVESLRTAADNGANTLTPRERDIVRGIARGESIKSMAARLGLKPKTVNNQYSLLKEKLSIFDTVGIVRYAIRYDLVEDF